MHRDVSENLGSNAERSSYAEERSQRETLNAVKSMMQVRNIRENKSRKKSKQIDQESALSPRLSNSVDKIYDENSHGEPSNFF